MGLLITLNGQMKEFLQLPVKTYLSEVIAALDLKDDRIAVEHNGLIAPRDLWQQITVNHGDRLEIVHFVGGGSV